MGHKLLDLVSLRFQSYVYGCVVLYDGESMLYHYRHAWQTIFCYLGGALLGLGLMGNGGIPGGIPGGNSNGGIPGGNSNGGIPGGNSNGGIPGGILGGIPGNGGIPGGAPPKGLDGGG